MLKLEFNRKNLGIIGIVFSTFVILFFSNILDLTISFIEEHISADHKVEWISQWYLTFSLGFFILILILVSICNIFNLWNKLYHFVNSIIQIDLAFEFLTNDSFCEKKSYSLYILFIGPIIGSVYLSYFFLFGIPPQEGFIESSNSLLLLLSSIILLASTPKIKKSFLPKETQRFALLVNVLIAVAIFILFGEEISWGQQIFQWKSKELIGIGDTVINFQNETNLHNFFNPLFKFVYPLFGIGTFIVMFFLWFFPKKSTGFLFNLFVPHRSLFFLMFLMACASCLIGKETFEELLAAFILLYSIRINMCLRFPSKSNPAV